MDLELEPYCMGLQDKILFPTVLVLIGLGLP